MDSKLRELHQEFPLPENWSNAEMFYQPLKLDTLEIHATGLLCRRDDGFCVSASAAQLKQVPLARSYFELLERISTVEAMNKKAEIFPVEPDHGRWRHAKSNGIAVGQSYEDACSRARLELIERDTVLRSWFGGPAPDPLELEPFRNVIDLSGLSAYYSFHAVTFKKPNPTTDATVCAIFGFPRKKESLLVYGFGAGNDLKKALVHAQNELLQRTCFLWGEAYEENPSFSPTPDYHQELFLAPSGQSKIQKWLNGEFTNAALSKAVMQQWPSGERHIEFHDITPVHLKRKAWVVKATTASCVPLLFGDGYRQFFNELPEELVFHPIM